MSFRNTIICDGCETEFMLHEGMDMPPNWFGIMLVIADKEGMVPVHEGDIYLHFCSQECLSDFSKSKELREKAILIDKAPEEGEDNVSQ